MRVFPSNYRPDVIEDIEDDISECPLCPIPLDERTDDLVITVKGDLAHLRCCIDYRVNWQE